MSNENECSNFCRSVGVFFSAIILTFSICVQAAPVNSHKAEKAVKGWLKTNRKPLETPLPSDIVSVEVYSDQTGDTQYFVVNLEPEGYVIVSPDDRLEPVIAFSSDGSYEPDNENPLFTLITRDTLARKNALKDKHDEEGKKTKKQKKWDRFLAKSDQTYRIYTSLSSVTDMRVAPFIESRWSQSNVGGSPCYNYYTPPNQEPDSDSYNNYPCGCVATAMAQLMRYYEYPTTAIEYRLYDYQLKEEGETEYSDYSSYPKGGDGAGGAYDWSNMPLIPSSGMTQAQRIAIGGICLDAGLSCDMGYTPGASGATSHNAQRGLVNTFMYENVIHAWGLDGYGPAIPIPVEAIRHILNSNLDAALPVMLGIYTVGSVGGHAVLADGYGYDGGTLYHHINMGWGGSADAWYTMPDILSYDAVSTMNYNIYPAGTGEIISGRITNDSGLPVEGVTVEAFQGETVIRSAVTNQYGVYALSRIPSEQTYTIYPQKEDHAFNTQEVTVGLSEYDSPYNAYKCGNICEVDFVGTQGAGSPPVAYGQEVIFTDSNSVAIELYAIDDGLPSPGALSYIITSLPEHGWLFDPNDGLEIIDADMPYTLQNDSNSVIYQPCPYYFVGEDTFSFKANDGGSSPDGGDSNIADVNIVMNMLSDVIFEEDVNTNNDYIPFKTDSSKVRCQAIYHASEVGGAANSISALSLKIKDVPPVEVRNWTIQMKHTAADSFPTGVQPFETEGWTKVYDANETITTTGWYEFVLDRSFQYNGTDNLMIDFSYDSDISSPSGQQGKVYDSTRTERRIIANWHSSTMPTLSHSYNWANRVFNLKLKTQPDTDILYADFDYDCMVNADDLMTMIDTWLAQDGDINYNPDCDISVTIDNKVDLADYAVLASEWLEIIE